MRYLTIPSPLRGHIRHLIVGGRTASGFSPYVFADLPAALPRSSVAIALWGLRGTLRHVAPNAH